MAKERNAYLSPNYSLKVASAGQIAGRHKQLRENNWGWDMCWLCDPSPSVVMLYVAQSIPKVVQICVVVVVG